MKNQPQLVSIYPAFVYSWRNLTDGRLYIGWHKGDENDGYICSSKRLLEEYREDTSNFVRYIIARGTSKDMAVLETKILQSLNVKDDPMFYNQHNGNGLYHLKRQSAAAKRKIGNAHRGIVLSSATRKKISSALLGRKMTDEQKLKRRGWKHTAEARKEMSIYRKGRKVSDETKARMSAAFKGRVLSPEHKAKISAYWKTKRQNSQS